MFSPRIMYRPMYTSANFPPAMMRSFAPSKTMEPYWSCEASLPTSRRPSRRTRRCGRSREEARDVTPPKKRPSVDAIGGKG